MRHLILIIAIILTYFVPNNSQGVEWFVDQSKISTAFVLFLYFCQYIKYQSHLNLIILIEILSTIVNFICAALYAMSLKTAFIYVHYETIMTLMFIAELAIIIGAVIRDVGVHTLRDILHLPNWHTVTRLTSNLFIRERKICKTP